MGKIESKTDKSIYKNDFLPLNDAGRALKIPLKLSAQRKNYAFQW